LEFSFGLRVSGATTGYNVLYLVVVNLYGIGELTIELLAGPRGLVFKAHRLVYHSTLGLRVIKKRREDREAVVGSVEDPRSLGSGPQKGIPKRAYRPSLSISLSLSLSPSLSLSLSRKFLPCRTDWCWGQETERP